MKRALIGVVALIFIGVALWLLAPIGLKPTPSIEAFLTQHWQRPLAPQGTPPAHYSALEASLDPAACGQCHQSQYQDWQTSLHSHTMGPGIQWQLRLMPQADVNKCLDCHAPLAEQKALVSIQQNWSTAPKGDLPNYVPATLSDSGLVCAACHVRKHQRFGPPPRAELPVKGLAHNGFVESPAFSNSQFCASCHQFSDNGPRTNGKLRENTYQEWLASPYAEQGTQCQSCHMPDRKHQWRGIHYSEKVAEAISTSVVRDGDNMIATLTNVGAGHLFPTYMVPKITMQLVHVQDQKEQVLAEHIIGWQVSLDLETEQFDTRLAPQQSVQLSAHVAGLTGSVSLRLLIAPREHYERSFNYSLGFADQMDSQTVALLKQASQEAQATRYSMMRETVAL